MISTDADKLAEEAEQQRLEKMAELLTRYNAFQQKLKEKTAARARWYKSRLYWNMKSLGLFDCFLLPLKFFALVIELLWKLENYGQWHLVYLDSSVRYWSMCWGGMTGLFWEKHWSLKWRARGSEDDQRRCGRRRWRRRARVLVWKKRMP